MEIPENIKYNESIDQNEVCGFYRFWIDEVGVKPTVLLSLICSTCNKTIYCDDKNKIFSKKLHISTLTVLTWIKVLEEKKLIFKHVFYYPYLKQTLRRHIVPYLFAEEYKEKVLPGVRMDDNTKELVMQKLNALKKPTA